MAVQELLVRLGLDNASFSKQLKVVNKEFDILEAQLEASMKSFKNFENTNEGLTKKIQSLEDMISVLGDEIKICEQAIEHYGDEMKKLEQTSEKFKTELEMIQKQLASKSKKLEEATEKTGKLQKEVSELIEEESRLTKLKQGFDEVTQSISKTENAINQAQAEFDQNTKTIGENKKLLKQLKEENQQLSNKIKEGKGDVSAYSTALKDNEERIKKLQTENKQLAQTNTNLKNSLIQNKQELKELNNRYSELQAEAKRYKTSEDQLSNSLKEVRQELFKKNNELKSSEANVEQLTAEVKQLEKAEESYQQQLDKTNRKLANANAEIQKYEEKIAKATAQQREFNNQIGEAKIDKLFTSLNGKAEILGNLGNSLSTFGNQVQNIGSTLTYGVSVPLATFGATATTTFMNFEERIRKVNAVFGGASGDMAGQFDYISEKAREYGRTTEWTATQVGEAYEYMAMAGWDVEESTEAMDSMLSLASIGMLDLGTTADIVTDTMTPFADELDRLSAQAEASGQEFNKSNYMVDIFSQTIRSSNTSVALMGETMKYSASVTAEAGASFEDMSTAIGLMANSGIKGSMAGTSLAQGITRLLAPTDKASALMEEFNISVAKNSEGGLDLEGTIKNLQTAFAGMEKDVQVANAKVIFGQTALKGWLPLISASADEWDNLGDKIANSTGATQEMMDEIEKSGAFQFKIMQSAIADLLIVIGDALAPAMRDIAETVTEFANKLSTWVTKMKETNPELLALIGKLGMMAVVVPPVIMLFGTLTSGLGGVFSGTSNAIKGFTNFAKQTKMVANGVAVTDGKVGLLAKGLGGLITTFGGTTVALTAGAVALGGLAIAVGDNDSALTWLQDKWGAFGVFVGGVCENLNGWFSLVFGNLGHLIMGVGKSIGAFLTGDLGSIDDIWRETWANMENTTAKAWSNINMETTGAIKKIRTMTREELVKVEEGFETVFGSLSTLTVDSVNDVAKELTSFVSSSSEGILEIMKGTSDSMAIMLEGIDTSKTQDQVRKKLEANLESMARSGKYNSNELKSDFEKAFKIIQQNATDTSERVSGEVTKITRHIGKLAQDGILHTAGNINDTLSKMDDATYETLKSLGGTWQKLFDGVEKGSMDSHLKIRENLEAMGTDTQAIIDELNKELQGGFDETGKKVEETAEGVKNSTKEVTESFAKMVDTIKENSETGMGDLSVIFAEGLQTLDVETLKSLRNTSDHWYSILDGCFDESGGLVENFAQQILWNLGWVSEQSPEKLEGFKDGLLQALVDANLLTEGEMEVLVGKIDEGTKNAEESATETGENIKNSIVPKGVADALGKELDDTNIAIGGRSMLLVENARKLGLGIKDGVTPTGSSLEVGEELDNTNIVIGEKSFLLSESARRLGEGITTGIKPDGTADNVGSELDKANNIIGEKSFLLAHSSSVIGTEIKENIVPEGSAESVGQQLDEMNRTIGERSLLLAESSKKAGQEAQQKFDSAVSEIGKDIQLDENIINQEYLTTQFNGAGTVAIQSFIEGWSAHVGLITEAINVAFSTMSTELSTPLESLSLAFDGSIQKAGLLNDTLSLTKERLDAVNSGSLSNLEASVDRTKGKIGEVNVGLQDAKAKVDGLASTSVNSLTDGFSSANNRVKELKLSVKETSTEVKNLSSKSLKDVTSQVTTFKDKLDKTKDSAVKLIKELDKIIAKSFSGVSGQLDSMNSKLNSGSNYAISFKNRLQDINNVTFSNVINGLANINSWLSTVRNNASNTTYAIGNISTKKPRAIIESDVATIGNFSEMYSRNGFDMAKYQTRGGYYTANSLAGTGSQAREIESQKSQLELMKQQNDLLRQLLLATTNIGGDINVSVDLDGRQVAKSTAKYMEKEINTISKRKTRLGGNF